MTFWRWTALVVGLALFVTASVVLFSDQRRHQRPVLVTAMLAWAVGLFAVATVVDAVL